jgi:hypothetical protein
MIIYGGCYQDYKCLRDIMVVDLEGYQSGKQSELVWTEIQQSGTLPCERWGHSACISKNSLFVFGYNNEIYADR